MRRVVVTGMGAVTPLGLNVEEFWTGLKEGKTAFGEITKFDTTEYKVHLAAEVKAFRGKITWTLRLLSVWNCFASTQLQQQKRRWNRQEFVWKRKTHTEWDVLSVQE